MTIRLVIRRRRRRKIPFHQNGCGLASYQTYLSLHNNDKIRPGLKSYAVMLLNG